MRLPPLAVLLLVAPFAATATVVHVPVEAHVDPHGACTDALGSCWDLDREALGSSPATTLLPDAPEGEVVREEGSEHVRVHARFLGRPVHLHGVVTWELEAAWNTPEHDDPGDPNPGVERVPCSDPAGCPDLTTDHYNLQRDAHVQTLHFEPDSCEMQEGSIGAPGERTLLRFTFRTPNLGSGDLIIGDPHDHPEWFEYDTCHGHEHFREYADYRLWTLEGYAAWRTLRTAYPHATPGEVMEAFPELRDEYVAGHKQGFCVYDVRGWLTTVDSLKTYRNCDYQGISVRWADEYGWTLSGQWIDVTDVPPGLYVLEAEVNPERLYVEESYANNDAGVVVQVP